MPSDRDILKSIDAIRRRAAAIVPTPEQQEQIADAELLAAIVDWTLAFDEIRDKRLENFPDRLGRESVAAAFVKRAGLEGPSEEDRGDSGAAARGAEEALGAPGLVRRMSERPRPRAGIVDCTTGRPTMTQIGSAVRLAWLATAIALAFVLFPAELPVSTLEWRVCAKSPIYCAPRESTDRPTLAWILAEYDLAAWEKAVAFEKDVYDDYKWGGRAMVLLFSLVPFAWIRSWRTSGWRAWATRPVVFFVVLLMGLVLGYWVLEASKFGVGL